MSTVRICILLLFASAFSIGFYIGLNSFVPKIILNEVSWDIPSLKTDLSLHVYGQEKAIGDLVTAVSRTNGSEYNVIVILGGPGVGKHYIAEIMQQYIKCDKIFLKKIEKRMKSKKSLSKNYLHDPNFFPKIKILEEEPSCFTIITYISNFKEALNHDNSFVIDHIFGSRYTIFQSTFQIGHVDAFIANAVTEEDMATFSNASEYQQSVVNEARRFEDYMASHLPHIHVQTVVLEPLKNQHVRWCLQDLNVEDLPISIGEQKTQKRDFEPRGCKTLV